MTSIVPIIHEVEDDYRKSWADKDRNAVPSITDAPPFDKRLVMIRKHFNHGVDNLAEKVAGVNVKRIQKQIDNGMSLNDISVKEDIATHSLNYFISMGVLHGKLDFKPVKRNTKRIIYKLFKNDIEICIGSKREISELTNISISQLNWLMTKRYGQQVSRGEYRLERI